MRAMVRGRMLGLATALCAVAALLSPGLAAAASGEIHGKVTDHLGDPIAGITVCAEGTTPLVGSECDWNTDAEGKYSIGGLHSGSYRVGFHVESNPSLNYVPQWYGGKDHPEEADSFYLAEGESREVNAQMQVGGQVHGIVADRETDLPIEGVEVCADRVGFFQTGEIGYCGRSNAAGEFTVKNLGTGQYRLEFRTEGQVNYVQTTLGSVSVTAGATIELEAHLVPGIKIEGTLTEAGTGAPVVGLLGAYSTPAVCALDPTTEARVKCAPVNAGGHYSIPGLPAGIYAVSFALDPVEEGLDLHPDGYVRRYWDEVPSFDEAALIGGTTGIFKGVDAVLARGEEVFPNCEARSACPQDPSSDEPSSSTSGITSLGQAAPGAPLPMPPLKPLTFPTAAPPQCKKPRRRVTKNGHTQCLKAAKKDRRSHRKPRSR